jgi:hypothetical protein
MIQRNRSRGRICTAYTLAHQCHTDTVNSVTETPLDPPQQCHPDTQQCHPDTPTVSHRHPKETKKETKKVNGSQNARLTSRRSARKKDLEPSDLTARELEAMRAIQTEMTLGPQVKNPAQLARDLCAARPTLSIPEEVSRAGRWCRANPERAPKARWNRFILSWVERSHGTPPQAQRSFGGAMQLPIDPDERRRVRNNLLDDAKAGKYGQKAQQWAESGRDLKGLADKLEKASERRRNEHGGSGLGQVLSLAGMTSSSASAPPRAANGD